jgi:hypothetical protein
MMSVLTRKSPTRAEQAAEARRLQREQAEQRESDRAQAIAERDAEEREERRAERQHLERAQRTRQQQLTEERDELTLRLAMAEEAAAVGAGPDFSGDVEALRASLPGVATRLAAAHVVEQCRKALESFERSQQRL